MRSSELVLGLAALAAAASPLEASDRKVSHPLGEAITFLRNLLRDPPPPAHDHSITVNYSSATLVFHLGHAESLPFSFDEGSILVGDREVGHYAPGGGLEAAWRELMATASKLPTDAVVAMLKTWEPRDISPPEAQAVEAVRTEATTITPAPEQSRYQQPQELQGGGSQDLTVNLRRLDNLDALEQFLFQASLQASPDMLVTVVGGKAFLGQFSIGSGQDLSGDYLIIKGTADVYGRLDGNLVTVDGDIIVHPGAMITGGVLAYNGQVHELGGEVSGEISTLSSVAPPITAPQATVAPASPLAQTVAKAAGLVGVFLSLSVIGFGVVLFARPNLEVIADTVANSFGRSLIVGILGQILVLPTFGMIVVGLVLSVAGVLLIPFAVVIYALLVVLAVVGGYLGVAHAMGETYTRRRMAMGAVGSPNSYRYLLVGLLGLFSLWIAWVIFGWVPVAGSLINGAAILVTWVLGTAGFGAAVLSRAGVRENFTGRILPPEAMTDEYLWATPQFGVPAVKRPINRTTPPPV